MIAMALSCNPQLLIADEPTTALDVTIQAQILEILRKLRDERGMAIIFITHDLGVIAEIADDVLVMYPRRRSRIRPGARNLQPTPSTRTRKACSPAARDSKPNTAACRPSTTSWKTGADRARRRQPCSRIIEKKMDAARLKHLETAGRGRLLHPKIRALLDRPSLGRRPPRARYANRGRRHRSRCSRSKNLQVYFPVRRGIFGRTVDHIKRRRRHQLQRLSRPNARPRRRIGLRQNHHRPRHPAADRAHRRPASCTTASTSASSAAASSARCAAKCKSSSRIPTARSTRG